MAARAVLGELSPYCLGLVDIHGVGERRSVTRSTYRLAGLTLAARRVDPPGQLGAWAARSMGGSGRCAELEQRFDDARCCSQGQDGPAMDHRAFLGLAVLHACRACRAYLRMFTALGSASW